MKKQFSVAAIFISIAAVSLAAATSSPNINLTSLEQQFVASARSEAAPHFNGARVIGMRPNTPLIYSLAASGSRPVSFSANHLPRGLKLDSATGIITGSLKRKGEFTFTAAVKNSAGNAKTEIKIVVGDQLALTPPMGWNSYDAFGDCVVESEVLANARWLKQRLQPLGWDTVVVDFRWYDSRADGVRVQNPEGVTLDEFGRCIPPTNRFPSAVNGTGFKTLADQIHALGLKFGIHIMRGIPRRAVENDLPISGTDFRASQAVRSTNDPARVCKWNRDMYGVDATTPAGRAWYRSIAKQYADWGVDYIKCDDIANLQQGANVYPQAEVEALAEGLRVSGRSIVLSLSPGPALVEQNEHLKRNANLWRISGDFWDNWPALNHNFDLFANWQTHRAVGHWPDGDMIPFGHICVRNCDVHPDRWTKFTRDEQVTLMSLWALAPSPLMLGMNLPNNDDWTTALLTNPEVIAVNQDPLGQPAQRMPKHDQAAEMWVRELADTSSVVGLFNRTDKAIAIHCDWRAEGFSARPHVRDLWLRKNLRPSENFSAEIPPHGCVLLRVK